MIQPRRLVARLIFIFLALPLIGGALHGQETRDLSEHRDLTSLSVDDLMNLEVTSLARKGQKLSDTPAAVFVITQEDIQRSGATSIADVLRIVPGLQVTSVDGNIWAITARGMGGQFANKLLVLIDGRTVYTPFHSGVYWDVQDTLLEDIERIEVIRGPGGTLWGANAVNGIISIITRSSVNTPGTLVSTGGGTSERAFGAGRYGGSIGNDFHYRVYGKTFDRSASKLESGGHANDEWNVTRGGFRTDWSVSPRNTITSQGDVYTGQTAQTIATVDLSDPLRGKQRAENNLKGGNLLLRWTSTRSRTSETSLQLYYDNSSRDQLSLTERHQAFDLDFQHSLSLSARNSVVWGVGIRTNSDRFFSLGHMYTITPSAATTNLFSGFLQDDFNVSSRLRVTIGTKLTRDNNSGLQLQPSVRALLRPSESQSVWIAATRAVRTQSRFDLNGEANLYAFRNDEGRTVIGELFGNPTLKPEIVASYEAGYRWQPGGGLSLDAAAFYSDARKLRDDENGTPYVDDQGRLILPQIFRNSTRARSLGTELFATARIGKRWNLTAGYALLHTHWSDPDGDTAIAIDEAAPVHQFQLRSSLSLTPTLELDSAAYYVSALSSQGLPGYTRVDIRLAWQATPRCELSLVGQNLMNGSHREFSGPADAAASAPVSRNVYGKVTWRF